MDNNTLLPSSFSANREREATASETRAELQREQLSRRPSYKKILDELSSETETKPEPKTHHSLLPGGLPTGSMGAPSSGSLFPGSVIVTSDVMSALAITLTNTNNNSSSQPSVVALSQGQNSEHQQLVQPSATIMSFGNNSDMHGLSAAQVLSNVVQPRTALISTAPYSYIHRPPTNQVVMTAGMPGQQSPQQMADDATKKREIRLMKNREAARHCRVKKKEYLKCLEERVQILESQNKKLIDELKILKEFYIQHKKDYPDQNL